MITVQTRAEGLYQIKSPLRQGCFALGPLSGRLVGFPSSTGLQAQRAGRGLTTTCHWHTAALGAQTVVTLFGRAGSLKALTLAAAAAGADKAQRHLHVGIGPRYVISVTKNKVKNEAGCYQNRIASHFNCLSGIASCNLKF